MRHLTLKHFKYNAGIALQTILFREIQRILRIWPQTILPPVVTMTLYFLIFGHVVGDRIGRMDDLPYLQFIAPGLIMMSIINNAYANVVASFFSARFQKNIEEMLITPMSNQIILLGFVSGGIFRGLIVGACVTLLALSFTHLRLVHPFQTLLIVILSATLFSLAGFCNAIFAKKFDDISIIPTFVLTPLTYLGGIFYSIDMLPNFWKHLSYLNPIVYMINGFRYGVLGMSDIHIITALSITFSFIVLLWYLNLYLLENSNRLRE